MPPWLRRLFSRSYRNALSAEASGEYMTAAEHYALAGMHGKVAEMHLIRAGRVGPEDRANALDDSLRWLRRVGEGTEVPPSLVEELSKALVEEARSLSEGDPHRKALASEAGELYKESGSHREAAEAFVLAKNKEEALRCYEAAGDIETMERLLEEESSSHATSRAVGEAFDQYETALVTGERSIARRALRICCSESPGQGYERMFADLEKRFPPPGAVDVRFDGLRFVIVGATPATMGRGDAHIKLRHAGISRRHAAIDTDDTGFHLRDAGSRNGTLLAGLPLAGRVPLSGSGVIGLGDNCTLQFVVEESSVVLEVLEGPDRGLKAVIVNGSWRAPGDAFMLSFKEGMAVVEPPDSSVVQLNGKRTTAKIVLLVGDIVESATGHRLEVEG